MNLWQRLLCVFATSTEDDLVLENQYRHVENQILRSKLPAHITITPQERRRLLRYAKPLWGRDFFTQKILTTSGFVDCFVFFFLHVGSRQVYLAGITTHPTEAWVAEQAKRFVQHAAQQSIPTTHVIRDFDSKFGTAFDAV